SHRRIEDLLDIMARLRAPDGCPWDRKQTHASILSNLIEEAYEFVDAVENGDAANMKEELGDLLLQVVFQAQMAKEAGEFSFPDVVEVISEKLVRRHPHVFGESTVDTAEGVQKQWDEIKQREKAEKGGMVPEGTLAGIPKHLPALLKAEKIQKKASQAGFDWPDWRGPLDKVREEIRELEAEIPDAGASPVETGASPVDRLESEFGDLLFAVVSLGRKLKVDPEKALSRANRKFQDRYVKMETLAKAEGRWQEWETLSLEEKDVYWERVKREEKRGQ
ncbi:MAG TPA: nucleoside triphosphate pyrophosphohydrolase, partial [Fibrobacteria bacterium]|nr:nucleoside triphosphate pyrophosphohydrolase [Fibrobacteria bacterium]